MQLHMYIFTYIYIYIHAYIIYIYIRKYICLHTHITWHGHGMVWVLFTFPTLEKHGESIFVPIEVLPWSLQGADHAKYAIRHGCSLAAPPWNTVGAWYLGDGRSARWNTSRRSAMIAKCRGLGMKWDPFRDLRALFGFPGYSWLGEFSVYWHNCAFFSRTPRTLATMHQGLSTAMVPCLSSSSSTLSLHSILPQNMVWRSCRRFSKYGDNCLSAMHKKIGGKRVRDLLTFHHNT